MFNWFFRWFKWEEPSAADEPFIGQQIRVSDPDDAREKLCLIAARSGKAITGSAEWDENGGTITIQTVDEAPTFNLDDI